MVISWYSCRELTKKILINMLYLKMMFRTSPRWDMLVSWRVFLISFRISLQFTCQGAASAEPSPWISSASTSSWIGGFNRVMKTAYPVGNNEWCKTVKLKVKSHKDLKFHKKNIEKMIRSKYMCLFKMFQVSFFVCNCKWPLFSITFSHKKKTTKLKLEELLDEQSSFSSGFDFRNLDLAEMYCT